MQYAHHARFAMLSPSPLCRASIISALQCAHHIRICDLLYINRKVYSFKLHCFCHFLIARPRPFSKLNHNAATLFYAMFTLCTGASFFSFCTFRSRIRFRFRRKACNRRPLFRLPYHQPALLQSSFWHCYISAVPWFLQPPSVPRIPLGKGLLYR